MPAFEPLSIVNFSVNNNPLLSHCATETVCEFLDTFLLSVVANAPGCNSNTEIRNQCLVAVHETSLTPIVIYPNPTGSLLYLAEPSVDTYASISAMNGQVIFARKKFTDSIDVSYLPGGVYLLYLEGERHSQVVKVVKY